MANESEDTPGDDGAGAEEEAAGGEATPKAKRSHGERASSYLKSARRGQREATDPAARVQFLHAEAEVYALLDVAAALRGEDGTAPD